MIVPSSSIGPAVSAESHKGKELDGSLGQPVLRKENHKEKAPGLRPGAICAKLVEAAGIEPASASPPQAVLHA